MLQPRFETAGEKKLAGMQRRMSLTENHTQELWQNFMPLRHTIANTLSDKLFSLQNYPEDYFRSFNPATPFEKWAALEVSSWENLPENIHKFEFIGGLYAVFHYQGLAGDSAVFQYIYAEWLPKSGYILDNRPHFEILGNKFRLNDPLSEEEIWIPVRKSQ